MYILLYVWVWFWTLKS